jgi:hypothetical protein
MSPLFLAAVGERNIEKLTPPIRDRDSMKSSSPADTQGLHTRAVSEVTVLRTRGLTWYDWMIQVVVFCLFPVGVLFVILLSGPPLPTDVIPRLVGVVIFLAGLDLFAEGVTSVRRVELRRDDITFRFLFHSERRKWQNLEPGPEVPKHNGWWILSRYRSGRQWSPRGYRITFEQARAILSHPSCPKWEIPPTIRDGLGWTPTSS